MIETELQKLIQINNKYKFLCVLFTANGFFFYIALMYCYKNIPDVGLCVCAFAP